MKVCDQSRRTFDGVGMDYSPNHMFPLILYLFSGLPSTLPSLLLFPGLFFSLLSQFFIMLSLPNNHLFASSPFLLHSPYTFLDYITFPLSNQTFSASFIASFSSSCFFAFLTISSSFMLLLTIVNRLLNSLILPATPVHLRHLLSVKFLVSCLNFSLSTSQPNCLCTLAVPLVLLQVRLLYCSLEEAELIFRAAWAAGQAGPSHMWFAVGPALSGLGLEGLPKALFAIRPQGWRDEPRRYEQY